ncbi:MAG TPA: HD domain-containing phosphohydrolase [Vicinamibacterales bacterium]|nr:HD domain-containing phosphohydrolase [Vicinamibacterales bacterium]
MTGATAPVATLRTLPVAARAYVATVIAAGAACVAVAVSRLQLPHPVLFAALLGLAVATSAAKIVLPLGRSQSNLSLSHAVNFWALFALGPAATVLIATASAWAQCTLRVRATVRNPLHRVVFSVASLTVTVACAGVPVSLLLGDGTAASLLRAAAVAAPLYFFVNSTLVAAAIALSTRQPVVAIWHRNFLWSAPSYLAGAALAAFATTASERGWFGWLALAAVPLYLVFRSYHSVVSRLRDEQEQTQHAMEVQLATIEALALAIEAKAGCTPEHIRSIQNYAAMLAEAAGLSDIDVQGVRTAALLHDIGNMAVPEHILAKPDALTPEEFERVKIHPRVGADILCRVPFAAPVSELVLCHHERWDGLGYPAGIAGKDIPLGARILAIADCFSTLQADRPYRPARSHDEALTILQEYAGTAFDPELVDLLIARLQIAAPPAAAPTDEPSDWPDAEPLALRDIAGAHREEQTLYEIAQALGSSLGVADAMALIQDKVSRIVPFTTCALFLGDDEQGFVCRYAHGPGTEALLRWAPKSWSDLALRIPACADGRGPRGEDLAALLPCRLVFEGRLIGGLVIYHTVAGSFSDEHRRVLGRVSEQAAAVIYNSTRFEQTEHESHTDPLTGMPNRRSLDRQLEAGLARAIRSGAQGSVVVLDMDRLKEINDTYGHEAGDRALRVIGNVLKSTVRQNDLCARFAGDEFIVVLWDCLPEHEDRRVADLQGAVAAFPFEPRPGVRVSLSISAGAARFPDDGQTFEELLAAGDERMYRDKAGRRSRNSGRHSLARNERA